MSYNKIVVIILNYNDYARTQECIDRLIRINVSADMVIVDNCSTDNSYSVLREKYIDSRHVKVIKSERNGGYSYGNNYGIRYARTINEYEYICIMNPDVKLESDYLGKLCDTLSNHKEIAAISALMFFNGKFEMQNIAWNIPRGKEIYRPLSLLRKKEKGNLVFNVIENSIVKTEIVPGSFFIIKTKVYDEIGGLDEGTFLYNEENILGIQIKKRGYSLAIDTSCYYVHNHIVPDKESVWRNYRESFSKVITSYKFGYESRKYLCKKYYKSKYMFRLQLIHIMNLFAMHIKHLISFIVYNKGHK